ncbi:MAG: phosphatase PAP2 family protein [Chlamydia sp.]
MKNRTEHTLGDLFPVQDTHRTLSILWNTAPLFLFIALYPFIKELDLTFASYSFNSEQRLFAPPNWCSYLYIWGIVPGQLIFCIAGLISTIGFFLKKIRKNAIWRESIYLVLVLAIGSGVISHWVLKEHAHRPRPKQIIEFGGKHEYIKPFSPKKPAGQSYSDSLHDKLRSLPSGHATMGFYFLSFWFIGKRCTNRALSRFGLFFGVFLGVLLSISRILEGGHFFSDSLASFLIMWYTPFFLDMAWEPKQ